MPSIEYQYRAAAVSQGLADSGWFFGGVEEGRPFFVNQDEPGYHLFIELKQVAQIANKKDSHK